MRVAGFALCALIVGATLFSNVAPQAAVHVLMEQEGKSEASYWNLVDPVSEGLINKHSVDMSNAEARIRKAYLAICEDNGENGFGWTHLLDVSPTVQ